MAESIKARRTGVVVTIALAIKVHDGIVLAADSATTLSYSTPGGGPVIANVYNHANKIVNVHKELPLGLMTWGLGNIGQQAIATLAKDLRTRFQGQDPDHADWQLDPTNYSVSEVAARVKEFFQDELLEPIGTATGPTGTLGVMVGGFSSTDKSARAWTLLADGVNCEGPASVLDDEAGAVWYGQPEAITRLLLGFSAQTEVALTNLGVSAQDAPAYVEALKAQVASSIISAPMPIQDAIDLAEFLVDTTIKFTRFGPGYDTVGGPIEIAAITRHEGFKWVKRKHYYPANLNQ